MLTPIPLEQARELVLAAASPLPTESVAVADALGRVLAVPVHALGDVPRFANSAMDGFAVTAGEAGRTLRIAGESRAGAPSPDALEPASAIRISTGAALPAGAEAVVPIEQAEEREGAVTLHAAASAGRNVREAGEDMHAGQRVLEAGTRLGAVELAVAVTAGYGELECARRPRVALVRTGDELRDPGAQLAPGQIHDSNAIALAALARMAGAEVLSSERVGDDAAATRETLERALAVADVVAIAGGVSVGPHDHVKGALAELGAEERFWGIRIRPGKPTWFGTHGDTLVFGLPGNPVSAVVIFLTLARGALAALQGSSAAVERVRATLSEPLPRNAGRTEAVRVRLRHTAGGLEATPTGPQGSHVTTSLLGADGLAFVPEGEGELAAGSEIEVEPIGASWSS